jgi:hypothetical protein
MEVLGFGWTVRDQWAMQRPPELSCASVTGKSREQAQQASYGKAASNSMQSPGVVHLGWHRRQCQFVVAFLGITPAKS